MSDPLPRRAFGATPFEVTPLGLAGSFGISADDVERAYHEFGVNYFFVSRRMKGLSEGLRRLIKGGHRDDLVIASGAQIPTGGLVTKAFDNEAQSLGTDRIDVFHLFWVQARWYVTGKTWPAMKKLKDQGKVKALAISCHDRKMATKLSKELSLDVLMCRYNAAHRGAETEIFDALPEKGPAIVAYTATRWGKLLKPSGQLGPMSAGECYRFALGHPRVDVVLCGAADFNQFAESAREVLKGPLGEQRLSEVKAFGDHVRKKASSRISFGAN